MMNYQMTAKPVASAMHQQMANAVRMLAVDAVERAKSGHPGMPMGMADVATVLFRDFLKFDPSLAGSRPLRTLGRSRFDAAICAFVPYRL